MPRSLPCGKLQSLRGLGARAAAAGRAAARCAARPRGSLVIMFCTCAVGLAVAAQQDSRKPRDLLVSSTLERIAAPLADDTRSSVDEARDEQSPVAVVTDTSGPADQLIVNVRFTNLSEHVLDSLRITCPVPSDLSYVPQSASGPGSDVLFSVDSGRTFGRPEELTIATPDGVRSAEAADYTHVRWILRAPLDAGALGVARFRAVPR